MASPTLSVVIPTYNYAHTLPRAVASAFDQTHSACEVIVVDDGSTDNTQEVLTHLKSAHPELVAVFQPNGGAASARNTGIEQSSGDWLVFLDADDELLPSAIHLFLTHAETDLGLLIAPVITQLEDGSHKTSEAQKIPEGAVARLDAFLNKKLKIHNGGSAMNRKVFAKTRFDERLRQAEDLPVWAHALALFPAKALSEPAAKIYKHGDSLRHNRDATKNTGMALVKAVFNAEILPADCMRLENDYRATRCLSLFRSYYLAGDYATARSYYLQAVKSRPALMTKTSYTLKFLRSLFK